MKRNRGLRPVRDIHLKGDESVGEIVEELLQSGGFVGRHMAEGVAILSQMFSDRSCTRFLSFPASIMATGLRGVLVDMVKEGWFQVIVTTCGTLDHDVARTHSEYYHGSFYLDDEELLKKRLHRLGNVLVPLESYGPLIEEKVRPLIAEAFSESSRLSPSKLAWKIGKALNSESSLLYWAWKLGIPVIIPAPLDGAVGSQIWMSSQTNSSFNVDLLSDQGILSEIIYSSKKTGALVIGGGVSKHHTLWWNQFKGGLDYAVYLTTAQEYDGSLSGAEVREAVSWSKVSPKARLITIHGEATAILPFMVAAILQRMRRK